MPLNTDRSSIAPVSPGYTLNFIFPWCSSLVRAALSALKAPRVLDRIVVGTGPSPSKTGGPRLRLVANPVAERTSLVFHFLIQFAIQPVTWTEGLWSAVRPAVRSERDLPSVSWNHILNGETVSGVTERVLDDERMPWRPCQNENAQSNLEGETLSFCMQCVYGVEPSRFPRRIYSEREAGCQRNSE